MPSWHDWRRYAAVGALGLIALGTIGIVVQAVQIKPSVAPAPSHTAQAPLSTSSLRPPTVAAIPVLPEPSPTELLGIWNIEYYASTELTLPAGSPVAESAEQNTEGGYTLEFDSTELPQDPEIPRTNFSMRLSGTFHFSSAVYEFRCEHQGGCRVSVDGITGIDAWQGLGGNQVTRYVTEGNHRVEIEFYDRSGQGALKVLWGLSPLDTPTLTATPAVTITPSRTPEPARTKKEKPPPATCIAC